MEIEGWKYVKKEDVSLKPVYDTLLKALNKKKLLIDNRVVKNIGK